MPTLIQTILIPLAAMYIGFCIKFIWKIKRTLRNIEKAKNTKFECIHPNPRTLNALITFIGMVTILVPKVIGLLLSSLTFMILSYIFYCSKRTKCSKKLKDLSLSFAMRCMLFCIGVIRIRENNANIDLTKYKAVIRRSDAKKAPIIISNHVGYIDIAVAVIKYVPSFIAGSHVLNIPIIRVIAKSLHCVFVNRKSDSPKKRIVDAIKQRAQKIAEDTNQQVNSPLMIFPEGITSKSQYIKEFKKGAFTPLKPIQPIHIHISSPFYSSSYYWFDLLDDILLTLSQPFQIVHVDYLPVVEPVVDDVIEYGKAVHKMYVDGFMMKECTLNIFERDKYMEDIQKL